MKNKSVGEKLGSAVNAAKSKVNEMADRGRAEMHDAKSETTNNPVERLTEKGKAAVDRTKAEYHEGSAEVHARRSRR